VNFAFLTVLLIVLAVIVVLAAVVVVVWRGEIRTMRSLRRVDGNPYLYALDYHAAYDLDDLVRKNLDTYAGLLNYAVDRLVKLFHPHLSLPNLGERRVNCSSFQAAKADGSGFLFGRNYDYYENPTLVTFSRPKKGYASVAVSDMSFMGYSLQNLPGVSLQSRLNSLIAVYAPLDGMNETGFCASILALPAHLASRQDTLRDDVGTSILIRLMLDRCATVDEAVALLETVDVRHDTAVGSGFHYMIADARGGCAVIEFDPEDGWKTLVVRKPAGKDYMQVTNHLLAPKYTTQEPDGAVGNTGSLSWERYRKMEAFLGGKNGRLTLEEALECLDQVRWIDLPVSSGLAGGTQYQLAFRHFVPRISVLPDKAFENTQYSLVYDQQARTLSLRNWNDYATTHTLAL
jgi:hypothetical protein